MRDKIIDDIELSISSCAESFDIKDRDGYILGGDVDTGDVVTELAETILLNVRDMLREYGDKEIIDFIKG